MTDNPNRRDKELLVYLSELELKMIRKAAADDDRSASAWVRRVILGELKKK